MFPYKYCRLHYLLNKIISLTVSSESSYNTIIAFACNAKYFAIVWVNVVVSFWTVKSFLSIFYHSLPRKHWTRIRFFIRHLGKSFFSVLFIVKFLVYDHNMSCALEINSNSGFKWEHGESSSSTTKNISTITMPMTT